MQQCLANSENRQYLLKLLENDYKTYGLTYMRPQEIEKRNLKVILPPRIYNNILLIFQLCLESVKKDLISPLAMQA